MPEQPDPQPPSVAALAALRERLAHVRLQRDGWRQRTEEAERALAQARDAIADERRGRLAAEAAARGDGPTGPNAPTGHTGLRDQIAEALYRHTMDHAAGGPARLLTRDETVLWENSLARAEAVMPAVEAETAALRQRAEQLLNRCVVLETMTQDAIEFQCPDCSRWALWTDGRSISAGDETDEFWCQRCGTESPLSRCDRRSVMDRLCQRAETAERQRERALDQIATERRGRLAAEAAVRRVRQVLARKTLLAGPQAEKAVRVADVEAALDAEQPKETP